MREASKLRRQRTHQFKLTMIIGFRASKREGSSSSPKSNSRALSVHRPMSWNSIFFSLLFHPPLRCCWRLFHGIFIFPARQSSRAAIFIAHFYTSAIALVSVAEHICWREASSSARWRREVWANFYCSILLRCFFFSPSHIYLYFFSIRCAVCTTTLGTMEMKKA